MLNNIPIFLSSDNNYAPFVATAIASICENTNSFCNFYVLDGGINEKNKEKIAALKELYDNFTIEYIEVDAQKYFKDFIVYSYITLAAYYRFIIPQLKQNLGKILYLDVDIIVKKDIKILFNEDLDGKILGAIKDLGNEFYINNLKYNVEIKNSHVYFNSGILLIDCKKWREENITEKLFEIEKKYRGKLLCNDQDVLNKVFENHYKELPNKYNSIKSDDETAIRHYYAKPKPWEIKPDIKNSLLLLDDVDSFWRYAKKTGYYKELLDNCKYNTQHQIQLMMLYKKLDKKNPIKISIIVPVYNAEKYLRKCLDSLCHQTILEIEIICINDCSTDNSLEILRKYQKEDSRIKIIDFKENQGVSAARNKGVQEAVGEYVGFIDPDDWVDLNFYGKLYKESDSATADIVKGADINVIYQNGKTEIWEQNKSIIENKINFWAQFTTAIFKRKFIVENDIFFPEDLIVCEDISFLTKCSILAKSIKFANNANYYYYRHENSLDSLEYNSSKVDSFINYVNKIADYISHFNLEYPDKLILLKRIIAQIDGIRKIKVQKDSNDYQKLTKLYQQKVIEKMRLK